MKEIIKVDGMSCGHCVETISNALGAMPGVSQVQVDLKGKTVEVEFDENLVRRKTLSEAIEEAGFEVMGEN